MRSWPKVDPIVAAGWAIVLAVPWSVAPGRIVEDTKNDLYIDAWGFLARSARLWDPQVTWGGPANQGYGYLFPMGPFFGIGGELAPIWVVQRCWWMLLLSAGFVGMLGLLRSLNVGSPRTRVVGALAFVLAPRVVSSIAGLSAEIQPQLVAPLVLWPVVAAWRGSVTARRGALLSGLAILCCGGVNGAATLLATAPTVLYLVTRPRGARGRLMAWWGTAAMLATAWWLAPLLLLGRYAPPFLDWIEDARSVSRPVGMLDIVRGTTHWLGHVLTPGGAWWPAGYELVSSRSLIVLTTAVGAAGLAGLALRSMPERRWLWTSTILGVVALSLAHEGPLDSPLVGQVQALLDGPLAPFRNIHKVDVLVRLPLTIGLVHLVSRPARPALATTSVPRGLVPGAAAVAVILAGAPAYTGAISTRGTFEETPRHWVALGAWLDDRQGDGSAVLVPASNFGEYRWGRPIDEPLRALTSSPYAVRDAVPLAPAGTIRLLDEVERRLQAGRTLGGAAAALRAAGVRYLVVRNDLATDESGQPPVALARSAVRQSPGTVFVRGFGDSHLDATGQRVAPVEVYELTGPVRQPVTLWDEADVIGASGASEDLPRLAEAGLDEAPVIFDGDRSSPVAPGESVATDGMRARDRWFGAPRGQDLTRTLTRDQASEARDYLPWADPGVLTTVRYVGVRDVTASSSVADGYSFAGIRPARRPFAAVDGDPGTGWAALWDERPTVRVELDRPRDLGFVEVTPLLETPEGGRVARATRVEVGTDRGTVVADLPTEGAKVTLPPGETAWVSVAVEETVAGPPSRELTGIAELTLPGVTAAEVVELPESGERPLPSRIVLGGGLPGRDGCGVGREGLVCLAGQAVLPEESGDLTYDIVARPGSDWQASGTLTQSSVVADASRVRPGVAVTVSSTRSTSWAASAAALVDEDPRTAWSPAASDSAPEVTLQLARPATISQIRLDSRRGWSSRAAVAVVVDVEGTQLTRRLSRDGRLSIPPTRGQAVTLRLVPQRGEDERGATSASLELEGITLAGVDLPEMPHEVVAGCGEGPALAIDGRSIPTRARITQDGRLGLATVDWHACEELTLTGTPQRVSIRGWRGLDPASTVLTQGPTGPSASGPAPVEEPSLRSADGGRLTGEISSASRQRLLVTTQNANDGWRAELAGEPLQPQVVDGARQGFLVPAGAGGALTVWYGPDALYRTALIAGWVAALGLVIALAVDLSRRRGVLGHARAARTGAGLSRRAGVLVGVVLGTAVAGPAGLLAAAAGSLTGSRLSPAVRAAVVGLLVLTSGALQAAVSPGSLGPAWLEGGIRVVLVAALCVALTGGQPGREPRRG